MQIILFPTVSLFRHSNNIMFSGSLQEGASHKRQSSNSSTSGILVSGEKSTKHSDQPKAKRRRVTNKDDLIDS